MRQEERPITGKWMLVLAVGAVVAVTAQELGDRFAAGSPADAPAQTVSAIAPAAGAAPKAKGYPPLPGVAGKFLASHFAQNAYDWETASRYLNEVIAADPGNFDLLKRAMVLAVGTGDMPAAARHAQTLLTLEPENGFAHMIVAVEAMVRDDGAAARAALAKMPEGDMTTFAKPLLAGWAAADEGKLEVSGLAQVPMHLYHGALLSLMLGNKEQARLFTEQIMQVKGLTQSEALRVADMLAALGDKDKALGMYQALKLQDGDERTLAARIKAVEGDDPETLKKAVPPLQITTMRQGAALALYDMAFILFQEESDSSAKLFSHMALAVDPQLTDARLLLAETLVRNERYVEAIGILRSVTPDHPAYMESQRQAAQLLAEAGQQEEALAMMNGLYEDHGDIEALVRVGDIYRHAEDYGAALKAYNRAAKAIGDTVPEEYWHLLYARGMVHEREGHWKEAVADLTAAMGYRPNHPYLLNYLGYGWADKGENLEESLELIRRAVTLRPMDGYITDSLGWVLYRMQKFEEAVPHLERAVELLPYDPTINEHLGDAYWQVGRRMEARFQWRRAINNSEDEALAAVIAAKLKDGMPPPADVRSAASSKTDAVLPQPTRKE